MKDETMMCSFSGGATSGMMTNELLKQYPDMTICFANTGKECAATLLFVHQCNKLWGGKYKYIRRGKKPQKVWFGRVIWLEYEKKNGYKRVFYETASRNGEPFANLLKAKTYLPNIVHRYCTQELKVRVIKKYMLSKGHKHWTNIIGIRYDEPRRWAKTKGVAEKERWDTWMPLVAWKIIHQHVRDYWKKMPFKLELKEHEGNCDLCFLKGKGKKKTILREKPEIADWWVAQEEATGGTFDKRYSVKNLLRSIQEQPELFTGYDEPDIECFCNSD